MEVAASKLKLSVCVGWGGGSRNRRSAPTDLVAFSGKFGMDSKYTGADPGFCKVRVGGGARCMLDHLRCAMGAWTALSGNFEFWSQLGGGLRVPDPGGCVSPQSPPRISWIRQWYAYKL